MVDHQTIEPDYYVDRADPAIFIPDPEGNDKVTMLDDREELFDFNSEVEPILQVLIGKSLELARIEVIEDHERAEMIKHRECYKKLRESELFYTQKQEAKNKRNLDEQDRRAEQVNARKTLDLAKDKL